MFPMLPINPSRSTARRPSDSDSDSDRHQLVPPGDSQAIPDIDFIDQYENIEVAGGVNLNFDEEGNLNPESAQASGVATFDIVDEDAVQSGYSSYFSPALTVGPMTGAIRVAPVEAETPSCFTRFRERAREVCSSGSMRSCMRSCLINVCNVCSAIWYLDTDPFEQEQVDPREERGEYIDQDYDLDVQNYQLSTGQRVTYNPVPGTETGYQFFVHDEDEDETSL